MREQKVIFINPKEGKMKIKFCKKYLTRGGEVVTPFKYNGIIFILISVDTGDIYCKCFQTGSNYYNFRRNDVIKEL